MKGWFKWGLVALFLVLMVVIQFIPGGEAPTPSTDAASTTGANSE